MYANDNDEMRLSKGFSVCCLWLLAGFCGVAQAAVQPGFAEVSNSKLVGVDHGELLISELNCVACHQVEAPVKARLASRQAPVLDQGPALTPQYLRRLLSDPQSAKSGTTMPDCLNETDSTKRAAAVDDLVHFLVSTLNWANSTPVAADQFKIQQGRLLYHQVGCVACHAPQESAAAIRNGGTPLPDPLPSEGRGKIESAAQSSNSVPLGDLVRKTTVEELARFLKDPLQSRPSGRMPSLNVTDTEANAIAMYLLRDQIAPAKPGGPRAKAQGVSFQYFEGNFNNTADLEKQKPLGSGLSTRFDVGDRKNKGHFGLRLSGFITVSRDGTYTFYTESDDGSRLYIGDKLIVDNDEIHGPTEVKGTIDLKAGDHPILVTYFNGGAGASLKVSYAGPGISKREIPATALYTYDGQPMLPLDQEQFTADPAKVNRGRVLAASLGCASCHTLKGTDFIDFDRALHPKPLTKLSGEGGCLSENPGDGIPKFALSKKQREAIRQTLARREELTKPLDPAAQANRTMATLNCFACHARDGVGGPSRDRAEYFTTVGDVDLGDEGRLPPHLTRVGDKLVPDWLREVLMNRGTARPYMATRMPQFGTKNVEHLTGAFKLADRGSSQEIANDTSGLDAKFGRNLVGVGGMSCISCHTFGQHKSLGIPAMDLTLMTKRIKRDWFHRYLLDPASLRPGTRMPAFWPEGKSSRPDILSGNTDRQINAIWAFLSRGKEAGLPPGLVQGKMELVATNEPIIYRHFLDGAGSRAIGVGYPEKANLAFDANDLRLALIWQGSFIDAARHRTGRGDGFVPPLGYNTVRMPPGPAFALLDTLDSKWPDVAGKNGGFHLRGYVLDEQRRPILRYTFQKFEIEDAFAPINGDVDPYFRRQVTIRGEQSTDKLWFRAWAGDKIDEQTGGTFVADGKLKLHFDSAEKPLVRKSGGRTELLIPVQFNGREARFVEEINW